MDRDLTGQFDLEEEEEDEEGLRVGGSGRVLLLTGVRAGRIQSNELGLHLHTHKR